MIYSYKMFSFGWNNYNLIFSDDKGQGAYQAIRGFMILQEQEFFKSLIKNNFLI